MAAEETEKKKLYGILAEFRNPRDLMDVCRVVNRAGYKQWDSYSPFPIHGIEKAMGLKKSKLGWIVLVHAILGFTGAVTLMMWVSGVEYPMNISGKPYWNLPAFVPITFELTVLLSAFGAVFGMFFLNGLPKLHNPLFEVERFKQATDDGFFVSIKAEDKLFDEEETRKLLEEAKATHIENIYY